MGVHRGYSIPCECRPLSQTICISRYPDGVQMDLARRELFYDRVDLPGLSRHARSRDKLIARLFRVISMVV